MSDPTYGENLKKWLLENYPVEAVFMDEIVKTVNEMCQRGGLGKNLKDNEVKDIKIQIRKRPDTDYAELEMSTPALLFTIGMARAISDVILEEILPNIQPETKKCSRCSTINNKIAYYCYQCGYNLEKGK